MWASCESHGIHVGRFKGFLQGLVKNCEKFKYPPRCKIAMLKGIREYFFLIAEIRIWLMMDSEINKFTFTHVVIKKHLTY